MPVINYRSTGVEELLETAESVLIAGINSMLAEVYERRIPLDQARAERRQVDYVPLTYEDVPPSNFHVGNFPSLVLEEVPRDSYPYIVLMIEEYAPDTVDPTFDAVNVYRQALGVHCLAKASPAEGSEVVFRRAIRMSEAVYLTFSDSMPMRSLLKGFSNPTRAQPSIPWTTQDKGRGLDWWYQAAGAAYAVKSFSSLVN